MTITVQEISQIITLARRAPLQNMAEAEIAAGLLQKLAQHFAPAPAAAPVDELVHTQEPPPL